MKHFTEKRAKIDREMKKVYKEIDEDSPAICTGCWKPEFDHSHLFPKRPFSWLIARKENIFKQCRDCHRNFERNKFWLLRNGHQVIETMISLVTGEIDLHRRALMKAHIRNRLMKCSDHGPEGEAFTHKFKEVFDEDFFEKDTSDT